jgi:hypothetical protein
MPSFALSEVDGEFEVKVLDGLSVEDGIFDVRWPMTGGHRTRAGKVSAV